MSARSRRWKGGIAASAVVLFLSATLLLAGDEAEPQNEAVAASPEAKLEQAEPKPTKVSAGDQGFTIESGDGDLVLHVRVLVQADARFYLGAEDTATDGVSSSTENGPTDDFLMRRARFELTGSLFEHFDYRLLEDLAPSSPLLLDAWLRYTVSPRLRFQVGKIKLPIGLEREQTREFNLFNEFAYPTALVPNRDIGLNVHGQLADGALGYYAGIYDGTADGASVVEDADDHKTWVGRLFLAPTRGPAKGLGVGLAGTSGQQQGAPSPYRTIGQQAFYRFLPGVAADGAAERFAQQLYYFRGRYGLMSEHVVSSQQVRGGLERARLSNDAWQVTGTWVLTGEDASYRGFKPSRNFDPATGGWGAWQLVARITELDVDDDAFPRFADPRVSSTRASTVGVGIHWILNPVVRLTVDYNRTELDGGELPDEDVVIGRTQIRF